MKVLKIFGKVVQWLLTIVIGVLFVFSLILFVSRILSKDKLPMSFGYAFLSIETGSMEPTIMVDDVVIIKRIDKEDYKEGQIVAFWMEPTDNIPTVHRIVEIDGDEVTTKGDYVGNSNDPTHSFDDLIGVEVVTIPKLGKVVDFIRSPIGIISIIIGGVLIIYVPDLICRLVKGNDDDDLNENEG